MDALDLVKKITATSPTFMVAGETYYVVEQDRKLKASELLGYAKEVLASINPTGPKPPALERLVAATVDGKPIRWELPVVLTWAIDESSFHGKSAELAKTRQICNAATADWNAAAQEHGILNQVRFLEDVADPVFQFRYEKFSNPNLYAVAFFPNDTADKRVVNIGPTTFIHPNAFDPVGVIRHELGHVLGFRHEHIRPEAKAGMSALDKSRMEGWVTGNIGGEALTDYDSQSVMHYPLNGRGTLEFNLTAADKLGFKKLYTLASDAVREFPI